jgi:hypothetical protein
MAIAAEKALVGRRAPAKLRLERAQNAIEIAHGTDLLGQMGKLAEDAERIKRRAEEQLDLREVGGIAGRRQTDIDVTAPPNAKGMESGDTVIYVIVERKENVAEKTSVYEKRGVTNV